MADPLTPNVGLAVPIRGTDVGTWDIPVNGDFTLIDSMIGGITTIPVSSSPVTLTTSQAQVEVLTFTGTLISNVTIALPSIYKVWMTHNQITNSPSSFCITLVSTSGTSIVGVPPGTTDIWYDSQTIRYKNMGKLGEYWDYAGTQVPSWINACTIRPWLNCDGTTFSSAVYPVLANLLGSNTLPDARGRARYALDAGTNRVSSAVSGVSGNTIFAGGGDQILQAHTHGITDPGHIHGDNAAANLGGLNVASGPLNSNIPIAATMNSAFTGITINVSGSGGAQNMPPLYVGGITMIRA